MDPVSHVVMGQVVVASLDRGGRFAVGSGAAAAAMLGALAPDIDVILMPIGWDVYLRFHEIGTHSLAGALVLGGVVAALVRGFVPEARWRALTWAASLAAVSHLALDVLSGARIAPAWPLVSTRVTLPLVAMAEPWLVAVLVLTAVAMWWVRAPRHRTARAMLLTVVALLGVKCALYVRVVAAVAADPRRDVRDARIIQARWGSWWEWDVFERQQNALRVWRVHARSPHAVESILDWPLTPDSPLVGTSRSLDTVNNFLRVHELSFAIERATASGVREVLWSDVRFCEQPLPGATRIDCALWFGGTFDLQGRPLTQVVQLGEWRQSRPSSP